MKNTFLLALNLFSFYCFAQTPAQDSTWLVNNYTKIERLITMRDGVKLFTSIMIPNDTTERHPILIKRTPYGCEPYGENKFSDVWRYQFQMVYFKEKYIIVNQDVRGKFMSEGTFADVRPFIKDKKKNTDIDEASDAYDAIDWLVKNIPDNNGNVGVSGISYPGFYATMAALSNHPALKAVSPQAPVTDWFIGDDDNHNGVNFIMDNFLFDREFSVPRLKPSTESADVPDIISDDNYQYFLNQGTFAELKAKYFGDTILFWNELVKHPDYDSWWKARDARRACYNIKPAVLIVGGLFDAEDNFGAWNTYQAIKKQSPKTNCKLVEGPWFHGGWARSNGSKLGNVWFEEKTSDYYQQNIELPFFNYYLKGKGNIDSIATATVFVTGKNKWHNYAQWPPVNITSKKLFLQPDGKLAFNKSPSTNSSDSYISDPIKPVPYTEDVHFDRTNEYMTDDQRFASRRTDVLVYETEILQNDLTVTGPLNADLFVSLSTTDADFVVKVIDVFPDDFKYPDSVKIKYPMGGYQMLVRGDIMRGSFRNSYEKPEAFIPGKISEVKFGLNDIAHSFLKGHRIMVQIQSTWFPLADRNPQQFINAYTCKSKDLVKSTIHIYHDALHASSIELPVEN